MLYTLLIVTLAAAVLIALEAERQRRAKHRAIPSSRLSWLDDTLRSIGLRDNAESLLWRD